MTTRLRVEHVTRAIRSVLGRRMLIQYIGVALLPVIVLAFFFYAQVSSGLRAARDRELAEAAHAFADIVKERLASARRVVDAAAASPDGALPTLLAEREPGAFQAVAVVSPGGKRLAARGYAGDLPPIDAELRRRLDADQLAWRVTSGRAPRVIMFRALAPGRSERAILAAVVDPRYLLGATRAGPAQVDFCIAFANQLVAGCTGASAGLPQSVLREAAQRGVDEPVRWSDGDDAYRSSAVIPTFDTIEPDASWMVIATQAETYALAPVRASASRFFGFAVAVSLLVIALVARQVVGFVDPLERLLAGTRRIAQNDFTAQIPVQGNDEFARLAQAYNEMARGLGVNFAALNALSEIDQTILTKPDIAEVARNALRYVRYTSAVDLVVLGIFEGEGVKSMRLYALRSSGRSWLDGTVVDVPVEARQRLAVMPEASWFDAPPLPPAVQARLREQDGIQSYWIHPVARRDRSWGVMILAHAMTPKLSAGQVALVKGVADRLDVAFATVERDRKLHTMAHVDALTGLPNRTALLTLLTQALAQAHRHGSCVGLLFLDLDRFKQANDTLGHAVGDLLLQRTAERIRHNVREDDTVARLGGDEFTIVLGSLSSARDAGSVARQLIKALSRPFEIEGHQIHVGASVGIAIYPGDATDGDDLLKKADTAMYKAKDEGRNRFAFYEESMNLEARRRAELDRELRHALKHDEFLLHYQPQIDMRSGQVCAVEALVRWRHPERGLLYPDAFITFAEENGLIPDIGMWVMREACLQHQRWREAGVPIARVSVNVSNDQLRRPDFVSAVLHMLNVAQVPKGGIEIEVTESMFLEGGKTAIDALNTLVAAGVSVAIDDFGTGYSSFGYLKTLPASILKLDKSFLAGAAPGNDAGTIIAAMINMAHTLRKEVVAEGVELEEQLEFLRSLDCEKVQGYFYSRPIPADEVATYAKQRNENYALGAGDVAKGLPALPVAQATVAADPVPDLPRIELQDVSAAAVPAPVAGPVADAPNTAPAVAAAVAKPASTGGARTAPAPASRPADGASKQGLIEEVVLDEGLIEENVLDGAAATDAEWQILWPDGPFRRTGFRTTITPPSHPSW